MLRGKRAEEERKMGMIIKRAPQGIFVVTEMFFSLPGVIDA